MKFRRKKAEATEEIRRLRSLLQSQEVPAERMREYIRYRLEENKLSYLMEQAFKGGKP